MHPTPLLLSLMRRRRRDARRAALRDADRCDARRRVARRRRGASRGLALALLVGIALLLVAALAVARDPLAPLRVATRVQVRLHGGTMLGWTGVVPQRSLWDCGPAAAATLLGRLGRPVPPLEQLGALAGTTPRGTAMRGLSHALRELGVRHVAHVGPRPALRRVPLLAWVRPGHFVVVERAPAANQVEVLDPRVGRYRIGADAFDAIWPGAALIPELP